MSEPANADVSSAFRFLTLKMVGKSSQSQMSAVNQISVKAMMSYAEESAATANLLRLSKFMRLLVL